MSYYRRNSYSSSWLEILLPLIMCVAVIFVLAFGFNTCTHDKWNDGVCSKCDVRYELRAVYRGIHYYACPECGREVERFGS